MTRKTERATILNGGRRRVKRCDVQVLDYMQVQVEQLRATNRLGTAKNYEKAMDSFRAFLDGGRLALADFTEEVVVAYNAHLVKRGLVRNSISFYMRILRAVYNKAVRQRLVRQEPIFIEVYTGIDQTRKRAVSESVISELYKLQLPEGSVLALSRDVFIFSYCTRGMAFVDIAHLRKRDLQCGTIIYRRHKTGQLLVVRVEPTIQRIIDRYASNASPYLFPLLSSEDVAEAYGQYCVALNTYNRQLGRLSQMVGCGCKLTSYTARHSWATAARKHNVPLSVISAGMGHTSEQTTQIYLMALENTVIDDANRWIIRGLE
ncbi:MAG: site-specific integrase [Tidjanibacter sp.]|nr:site-specific integrase [Tidjanibacter sp.]